MNGGWVDEVDLAVKLDGAWVPVPGVLGMTFVEEREAIQRAALAELEAAHQSVLDVFAEGTANAAAMARAALEPAEPKRQRSYPTNPQGFARRGRRR